MAEFNEGFTWLTDGTDLVPAKRKDDKSFRVWVYIEGGTMAEDSTVIANNASNASGAGFAALKAIYDDSVTAFGP